MTPDWQAINAGPTPSLDEYAALEKADPNAFWRLDSGHHQNLLDAALAEVERLRASLIDANVEVERLRRDKVEITVSRGIDPKDPEGVTLRIEGSGEAWDFHVTDFTRYTTPPKWDVSRRAESAEAQVAALRERVADLEGQLAMRGTP